MWITVYRPPLFVLMILALIRNQTQVPIEFLAWILSWGKKSTKFLSATCAPLSTFSAGIIIHHGISWSFSRRLLCFCCYALSPFLSFFLFSIWALVELSVPLCTISKKGKIIRTRSAFRKIDFSEVERRKNSSLAVLDLPERDFSIGILHVFLTHSWGLLRDRSLNLIKMLETDIPRLNYSHDPLSSLQEYTLLLRPHNTPGVLFLEEAPSVPRTHGKRTGKADFQLDTRIYHEVTSNFQSLETYTRRTHVGKFISYSAHEFTSWDHKRYSASWMAWKW